MSYVKPQEKIILLAFFGTFIYRGFVAIQIPFNKIPVPVLFHFLISLAQD